MDMQKKAFLIRLFFLSVIINYIWEMLQMPLYQNMPFNELRSWLLCFRASLGDGIIILFIWLIGYLIYRQTDWFVHKSISSLAIILLSGTLIAIGIEIHALSTGRWAYSNVMPLIPVIGVGLSPLLQLLLLPWMSMWAAVNTGKNSTKK